MDTLPSQQRAQTQGARLRNQAQELGLEELWQDVVEETSQRNREDVMEQFQIYTTSAAVQQVLEQNGMQPIEIGGGAVLNYLLDEEGVEVFEHWRGTGDSDKKIAANGINGGRRDIQGIIEQEYGPRNEKGPTVTETSNTHHDDEKYTVRLTPTAGQQVELDLMRAYTPEQEEFSYDETEEITMADASIKVPSLEQVFVSKLESYEESGRDKDRGDLANLLYVQEQRNKRGETEMDARDLYNLCDEKGLRNEYLGVLDEIEESIPFGEAAGNYVPSEEYLDI